MRSKTQKRIAATILKGSKNRVWFDRNRLEEIKEAITKADVRSLIKKGAISIKPIKGTSNVRVRKRRVQKVKKKRKGHGSRKGKENARDNRKKFWMNGIRLQRKFLKELKDKGIIDNKTYRMLYLRAKGGFFRSRRHLKLYINEHKLAIKKK